jgi:hypothetical protein
MRGCLGEASTLRGARVSQSRPRPAAAGRTHATRSSGLMSVSERSLASLQMMSRVRRRSSRSVRMVLRRILLIFVTSNVNRRSCRSAGCEARRAAPRASKRASKRATNERAGRTRRTSARSLAAHRGLFARGVAEVGEAVVHVRCEHALQRPRLVLQRQRRLRAPGPPLRAAAVSHAGARGLRLHLGHRELPAALQILQPQLHPRHLPRASAYVRMAAAAAAGTVRKVKVLCSASDCVASGTDPLSCCARRRPPAGP